MEVEVDILEHIVRIRTKTIFLKPYTTNGFLTLVETVGGNETQSI